MITVVGEALIDLVDAGDGETFRARPGGSPYNVAVAAARLGSPTRLLARLADDRFGRLLRAHALASGVDLSGAPCASEPSTLAVVTVDREGAAEYDFYIDGTADWQWTPDEVRTITPAAIVHFGSLASWLPPGDAVVHGAVAGTQALVSYDPNVRPALIGSRQRAQQVIGRNVAVADVVKTSDEDLRWLYPGAAPHEIAARWLAGRAKLVVVTRGGAGASAYGADGLRVHRPAAPVEVIDTVGAGDAFMGALLAGLDKHGVTSADALRALTDVRLAELLDEALLAAALTCARPGADPPSAIELSAARQALEAEVQSEHVVKIG